MIEFEESMCSLQLWHARLFDYKWSSKQMGLKYCCLASVLSQSHLTWFGNHFPEIESPIRIIQGYNSTGDIVQVGISFISNKRLKLSDFKHI